MPLELEDLRFLAEVVGRWWSMVGTDSSIVELWLTMVDDGQSLMVNVCVCVCVVWRCRALSQIVTATVGAAPKSVFQ